MKELHLSETVINEMKQFVDKVEQDLLNPANVCYFEIDPEQLHEDQIAGFNSEQLNRVATKSGVYAIWITTAPNTLDTRQGPPPVIDLQITFLKNTHARVPS